MTDYAYHAQRDRDAQNSARQGWAWAVHQTTGTGTITFKRAVNFGVSFYEKPMLSYGYEVLAFDPDEENYPNSSGFVYEWVQNEIDDYVGAYVGVTVTAPLPTNSGQVFDAPQIEHHFTFTAKAWKDVSNVGGQDEPTDTGTPA